ncbi:patatin-like phospholipase domain-containing protein 5 isoform X1 [Herpailurus yagouaroundi]|uniref:patatin-like phospholipase domain-containing protein 5 isoform X1 n=1 Tax=Herpailurus yagouaroundi TaxID=1608482 RepID=UPI001AD6D8E4|nr:patatin-like phospholipase domain-containing protein 5 isoform X1 [Puma yagouaroundi]
MLPSKPYENPEDSGLWLPLFRRGPSRAGDPAPEITRFLLLPSTGHGQAGGAPQPGYLPPCLRAHRAHQTAAAGLTAHRHSCPGLPAAGHLADPLARWPQHHSHRLREPQGSHPGTGCLLHFPERVGGIFPRRPRDKVPCLMSLALVCTLYIPFYCGTIPPEFRGERYFDGGLSNNLPFADSPSTITVSPFHGTVDICPQSTSASIHELNTFNTSFQICTKNFFLGFASLISPSPEMVADNCRQGYLDALRFLERRGLTKEPVLCMLVSKEPPAPANGTQDTDHDGGQKGGLSVNWSVPNVLVKDVPDFERLSPELEAALKKACMRDTSPWAQFCRSGPGRALTYFLLPWTLPFEYVYFRSRRLVAWLPDVPADLGWIQGELQSLGLRICSRSKDQLRRLFSLPVTSPLQPGAPPPVDPAKEPRPPHQA